MSEDYGESPTDFIEQNKDTYTSYITFEFNPTELESIKGAIDQIKRDLYRTFPTIDYFRKGEPGSFRLNKLLKLSAMWNKNVGYV